MGDRAVCSGFEAFYVEVKGFRMADRRTKERRQRKQNQYLHATQVCQWHRVQSHHLQALLRFQAP